MFICFYSKSTGEIWLNAKFEDTDDYGSIWQQITAILLGYADPLEF